MDYKTFVERKSQLGGEHGFKPIVIPKQAFDFQEFLIDFACRQGRSAIYADCGTGKTIMQLAWADNVMRKTNKPVLIVAPLSVSLQTVGEGQKFGYDVIRSLTGKVPNRKSIVTTNYERVHYFNPDDFAGMVADECFAPGTLIDTPSGRISIENIREGMYILNASGIDSVSDVHRREVPYAVKITAAGKDFIASPNHPIFTQRGWIGAQHLQTGDYTLETSASMRLVRNEIHAGIPGEQKAEILRDILLSEMADGAAGNSREGLHERDCKKDKRKKESLVSEWQQESQGSNSAHSQVMSEPASRGTSKDQPHIESHRPSSFRAWGKWTWHDGTAIDHDGCFGKRLESGICFITGSFESGLSVALQDRLRRAEIEARNRGGWHRPQEPQETCSRSEEGCHADWIRLDSIEILERGHPELEKFRDAEGKLYFYDLGATRHPSYSVNGILVHNSSILKNFDGVRKAEITEFMRLIKYRLLCTATPSPNDYIELGTSSEALGYLGHMDMLAMFFRNDDNSLHPHGHSFQRAAAAFIGSPWRLKAHAHTDFWRWVSSWARALRKPSDLGFSDKLWKLPPLVENRHVIESPIPAGSFFATPLHSMHDQRDENRRTVQARCEKAAELIGNTACAVAWGHLNAETDLLEDLIDGAMQVKGSDPDEKKEEYLNAFRTGQIKRLVTKPKIAAYGLNWQHCNCMTYFADHSYEKYYQAMRRLWRFGQKRQVTVNLISTEALAGVLKNQQRKAAACEEMFDKMVAHMREALNLSRFKEHNTKQELPPWLSSRN